MQFLPWVRRGLAAELGHVDDGATLPARASFPVRVTVNGQHAEVGIDTYGPGDVTGLDLAAIARTSPARFATNVAPDEFVTVEFADADLPWMFTPASAATDQRLRPWLVLVVVTDTEGVTVGVDPSRPLPTLTVAAPAVPADELPDLAQSWAWAHAQVVTSTIGEDPVAAVDGRPGQGLSRLVCPRRLRPGTRYIAALVPAFDLGVDAGFGRSSEATEAAPAWSRGAVGDSVSLPVYYHWEFTTGPPGDFESLARRLRPMAVPGGVGESPMFIGDAHPALPPLAAEAGGVVSMEGALRAPLPGAGTELDARHASWVDALTALVDETADAASGGTAADAEAVAPPIYGQWHVGVHQVPGAAGRPRWLRDLNADPRHRAAAGLAAEVVRANQETYMDAAWRQVGDVIAANRLLDRSRAIAAIAERVHARHVVGIDPVRALTFVDRAQHRLPFQGRSLASTIDRSAALPGFTSRSFRRLASPRNALLRQAERRAGATLPLAASADIAPLERITRGDLAVDADRLPDGIRSTTLHAAARQLAGVVGLDPLQLEEMATTLESLVAGLAGATLPPVTVRPDLAQAGVLTDAHLTRLRHTAALGDDLVAGTVTLRAELSGPRGTADSLLGVIAGPDGLAPVRIRDDGRIFATAGRATIEVTRPVRDVAAVVAARGGPGGPGSILTRPTVSAGAVGTMIGPARPTMPAGRPAVVGPVAPGITRPPAGTTSPPSPPSPSVPAFDDAFAALERAVGVDGRDLGELTAVIAQPGAHFSVIPRLDATGAAFQQFVAGFAELHDAQVALHDLIPVDPTPEPLDSVDARDAIVSTSRPGPMIEARLATRLRTSVGPLVPGAVGQLEVFQAEPVAPVMVHPVLNRPLYLDLAAFDQDRFLPGAGDIPDDAITLVETNPRFVESFMVGANHELNRELLWRRYPTDRRATALRRFWDRIDDGDDIDPIHTWQGSRRLGANSRGDVDGAIVLLVRGQLLRRYPNTVVYAAAATADHRIDPAAEPVNAVFAGFLAPDITFVGFDFDVDAATAGHGTMFVLQEQPAEPRFGLDVPAAATTAGLPASWADLTWGHVGVDPGGFLDLDAITGNPQRPLAVSAPAVTARFGADAAHIAAITYQRPFRVAVHSSEILT